MDDSHIPDLVARLAKFNLTLLDGRAETHQGCCWEINDMAGNLVSGLGTLGEVYGFVTGLEAYPSVIQRTAERIIRGEDANPPKSKGHKSLPLCGDPGCWCHTDHPQT